MVTAIPLDSWRVPFGEHFPKRPTWCSACESLCGWSEKPAADQIARVLAGEGGAVTYTVTVIRADQGGFTSRVWRNSSRPSGCLHIVSAKSETRAREVAISEHRVECLCDEARAGETR